MGWNPSPTCRGGFPSPPAFETAPYRIWKYGSAAPPERWRFLHIQQLKFQGWSPSVRLLTYYFKIFIQGKPVGLAYYRVKSTEVSKSTCTMEA